MEYRRLGRTGLKVSSICLGTMQFGWTATSIVSHAVMNHAIDLGCNFFDTADIYSGWAPESYPGKSEEIIGEWISSKYVPRRDIIIATKVRGKMGDNPTNEGLSRHHIMTSVTKSLARLQTDYIDLYQVHWPDEDTPLDETLETLNDLVHSGMVRYIGCSNYPAWLLTKSLWISDVRQLVRFDSLQPHYNLVHRAEFERELLPLCLDQQIGVIPYSPLAAGFLTGKYRPDGELPESPRASGIQQRYFSEQNFAVLDLLAEIAAEHEATVAQVALAWVLLNPTVSSAIVGANTVEQLEETAQAALLELSEGDIQRLDEASAW